MRSTQYIFIFYGLLMMAIFSACQVSRTIQIPRRSSSLSGSEFYKIVAGYTWQQRDSLAVQEILNGNLPSFFKTFVPVHVQVIDSATGTRINATYFVASDYLSVGTDKDWARINVSPMAAQKIADRFNCFLPTRKMVDDIYHAAKIKLEPVPMYAFRDSSPTMYQHHLIIEGQRQLRKGMLAGIKKDIVISGKLLHEAKPNRVAIYGWHHLDEKPIQPLYTGHINSWVDYSQGARLVYRRIKVGNRWMDYMDVLKHPVLCKLLCDEEYCDYYKYGY